MAPAPRVFTKLLRVVVGFLRKHGIRLVIYLDDLLFMNDSRDGVLNDLEVAVDLLESLGFLINREKSIVDPSQIMEYIGLVVDSVRLSFSLPAEKVTAVMNICTTALAADRVSLRELASILGNFTWAIPTVPYAQAHYRNMQRFYISEARRAGGNLDVVRQLPMAARLDLQWWVDNLLKVNGRLFFPKVADVEIYSDASLSGWGASCNEVTTRGLWTSSDALRHINEFELLGAFFALQAFVGSSRDIAVRLFLDNTTAICYINKSGGTRSRRLSDLANRFSLFCEERKLSVEAVHLPGVLNVVADKEFRTSDDSSDWKLSSTCFKRIGRIWSLRIDLFSSA